MNRRGSSLFRGGLSSRTSCSQTRSTVPRRKHRQLYSRRWAKSRSLSGATHTTSQIHFSSLRRKTPSNRRERSDSRKRNEIGSCSKHRWATPNALASGRFSTCGPIGTVRHRLPVQYWIRINSNSYARRSRK